MLGRKDDDPAEENVDWSSRLDRLLAGNLSVQVGSVLEALAHDVATVTKRSESLEALREELAALREIVAGRTDGGLEGLKEAIEAVREKIDAAPSEGRTPAAEVTKDAARIEAALAKVAAGIEALGASAPGADLVREIIESRVAAAEERIENLGRQMGGALGRMRVQIEEVAAKIPAATPDAGDVAAVVATGNDAQIAALAALAARLEERIGDIQSQMTGHLSSSLAQMNDRVEAAIDRVERRLASAPDARLAEAEQARLRRDTNARIDALSEQVLAAAARTKTSLEALASQLAAATGPLAARLDGLEAGLASGLRAIGDAVAGAPSMEAVDARFAEGREAAERGAEHLAHQITAVVGSVVSSMGELRSIVAAIDARPDVPPALRDEIRGLVANATGPIDDRLREFESRLANTTKADAEAIGARLDRLEAAMTALPGEERIAAVVQSIEAMHEQSRTSQSENHTTLSASVGAIYLRVRSLEQAIASLKILTERDGGDAKTQVSMLAERVGEVAAVEQRLASEIASIEEAMRNRERDRERDREIIAILAELTETAKKQGKANLADRLKGLVARSRTAQEDVAVVIDGDPDEESAKTPAGEPAE